MKRLSILAIILAVVCLNTLTAQQAFNLEPKNPRPGEKITITYDPAGTEFFGVQQPEAYAYLLEGALPLVKQITLQKKGNIYTGNFTTNDTTKAVFITFVKDEKRDNNSDKGYFT